MLVEMSVETRRVLKGPDVKLIRIFDCHFGFVWNGFVHGDPWCVWSRSEKPIQNGHEDIVNRQARTCFINREGGIAASIA
jgi:hypothetical protein